jgi:hypothetical protein
MDFPSNSQNVTGDKKPKETPKKDIQKVVTGEVVQKPKTIGRRLKVIFFGGEFKGAIRYIMSDVMLPAFKNMVVDATSKGVERVVYGEVGPRRRYGSGFEPGRPRVQYNSPIDRGYGRRAMLPDQPPYSSPSRRRQEPADLILVSREEAELVLERLTDVIDTYEVASVADLHDLVGLPTSHIDNKWGWTRLTNVEVRQVREGFLIELPTPEPI